jgi:pyridinium-3,5-biscarboxylic acid mononucleotide sulfurtransferase
MDVIETKYEKLKEILASYQSLIVAYSGGIDSALLVKVANDVLGDRALAVTGDSASVPKRELLDAKRLATEFGARMKIINTEETSNESYSQNPSNRCYYCKSELYDKLFIVAKEESIQYIANGTNVDDLGDYRPGLQAAEENRIKSPLRDAGFSKNDIRELSKRLNLDFWDKPASPCLASRIPYGNEVTEHKLGQVEAAEDYLKNLGIRELRVRHFGQKARIEVNKQDFPTIENNLDKIKDEFKRIGFQELEYQEFKSGALNLLINAQG